MKYWKAVNFLNNVKHVLVKGVYYFFEEFSNDCFKILNGIQICICDFHCFQRWMFQIVVWLLYLYRNHWTFLTDHVYFLGGNTLGVLTNRINKIKIGILEYFKTFKTDCRESWNILENLAKIPHYVHS